MLGCEPAVAADHRLPMLNAVRIPPEIDDAAVRAELRDTHNIEIGGGLESRRARSGESA